MSQQFEGVRKTFTAGTALNAHTRVKITAATGAHGPTVGLAGASDPSIGVCEEYTASGDPVTIYLANAPGTRKMLATAAAITANNPVYAAASGYVASTGTVVEGKAFETTAGVSGDILEVMPQPNSDISSAIAGTTNVTFAVDTDSATPKIALSAQAAGTGDFTTTIKPETTLSADNTIIVPESDGDTLMALALAQTVSAIKTHSADIIIQTASDLALGTTSDALLRFSAADASDPALVLALDDTSQQLHITDKAAVATDWARSAGTHPEVSIHSNTTPITDYLAIGNHDGTTASIDVVGGTTLDLKIAGTAAISVTATALVPSVGLNLGSTTAELGDIFVGDDKSLILGADQDVELIFSSADASNPATVLALDNTSQQLHVTDLGAVATDWNRSAGTNPEVAIHSNTTPATDYLAIGNHDGTTATIEVVGGTTLNIPSTITTGDNVSGGTAKRVGGLSYCLAAAGSAHTNSTDEAVLASYELPANSIKAGTVVKIRYQGIATAQAGGTTLTVNLRIGATTLTGTVVQTHPAHAITANDIFEGDFTLVGRAAPGAAAACVGVGRFGPTTDAYDADLTLAQISNMMASTNFATNGALKIELTADWSAADASSCRADIFIVEVI